MRLTLVSLFALFLAISSTLAAPADPLFARQAPLEPKNDPFYTPPAGFASAKPGDVLASRPVAVAIFGLLPEPVTAYQLLYRTTAIDGSAIATVTTVFKPFGAKTDRFVNFGTAYDSNGQQCKPSYTYRLGAQQNSLIVSVENLIVQLYLAQGYIVNSPDYEGPDDAFGPGRVAGPGVLDSMRAVKNFSKTLGLTAANPAIVGVGYSGGAIATGWAAGLQPKYAPELNIKGWAAGGVPANLTSVVGLIDGTVFAGFLPAAIQGLTEPSAYKTQLQPVIDQYATANGKAALAYAKTHCAVDDLGKFSFQRVQSPTFQTLGDRLLYEPRVASVLGQCTMGVNATERPTAPIFVYHSKPDEIIPYADTASLVKRWCAQGSSVKFLTYANGGHISGEIYGAFDAAAYVNQAFAGTAATEGCTSSTTLNNILNPLALGAALEPILLGLINALGQAGTNDANIINDLNTLRQPVSTTS
jgi:pimeloyl-ACP methyl ester carboxylesterase